MSAEVSAASLVLEFAMNESNADSDRATALFGLFALGLRSGAAAVDVLVKFNQQAFGQILDEVYEGRIQGREGAVMFTAVTACCYVCEEIGTKSTTAVRKPLEKSCLVMAGKVVKSACPKIRYQQLLPALVSTVEAAQGDHGDAVVASAASQSMVMPAMSKTGRESVGVFLRCDPARIGWEVRCRVAKPGLPTERWRELAQTLSVESVCVSLLGTLASTVPQFLPSIPHEGVWPQIVQEVGSLLPGSSQLA